MVSSDLYSLGFTMRFPRALSIRDDLTIADCMTATGTPITVSSDGAVLKPNTHRRPREHPVGEEEEDGGR